MGLFSQLPMLEARIYVQYGRYASAARVAVTLDATEHDVNLAVAPSALPGLEYRTGQVTPAPMVTLNWLTTYAVEPLPGKSDFTTGFRIIFGAPAPAGAELHYAIPVTP